MGTCQTQSSHHLWGPGVQTQRATQNLTQPANSNWQESVLWGPRTCPRLEGFFVNCKISIKLKLCPDHPFNISHQHISY